MNGLASTCVTFVKLPPSTPVYSKGVRYLVPCEAIQSFSGAMNELKIGQKRRKHIIVRRCPQRPGMLQLYTYHFPKTWSKACVTNREIIKLAQRRAHALEHATTREALEWRIRFFKHYFRVFKNHEQPEPGLKAYSRFYQYAYVSIYRDLKASLSLSASQNDSSASSPASSDVTFSPVSALSYYRQRHPVSALSYYSQRHPVPAYTLATPAFNNVLRQKHSFADHHSP